jgi:hypothetical protein
LVAGLQLARAVQEGEQGPASDSLIVTLVPPFPAGSRRCWSTAL